MTLSSSLKRRTLGALVLAALTIAPMFAMAPAAEAKPPRHAPAYGYRRNHAPTWGRRPAPRPIYRRPAPRRNDWRRPAPPRRGRYITRYRNGRPYRVFIR